MAKRIIIISSFPICIILGILTLVFVGIGRGQPAADMSIDSATAQIFSLIEADKWPKADAAVDKLVADYAGDANLPSAIMTIADTYCWRRKYDGAGRMYYFILDKPTDNSWATKARLGLTRLEILSLIEEKKYSVAREEVDFMVADFRDEPNLQATGGQDLPVALFHIGQEFGWQRRYDESKNVFDLVIEIFPASPLAQEVKLWSARANICSLINGRQAKDEEVVAAIDKLISDFEGDSRLPDALFWISREYEWTRGTGENRAAWYDAPNSVYQRLVQQFKYGQAEWDYKRLTYRMEIFGLMKEAEQNEVDAAIEKMVAEFAGRPEVVGELYWIACGYEEQPEKGALAKQIYERIIREYPDTTEADNAVLDIRRLDIWETLEAEDVNAAEVLMDKFIADFEQHLYAGTALGRVGLKCYKTGAKLKKGSQLEEAKDYFAKAEDVWNRIITSNLPDVTETPYFIFFTAGCRQELGRWEDALAYYQKVVDDYPDFEYIGGAQCAVGWCYKKLRNSGKIPKEQAEPIIEQAYTAVLTNFSDCYVADYAALRLGEMTLKKGDKEGAVAYYRMFLELAKPEDGRIAWVKETLSKLERLDPGLTVEGGTNPSTTLRTDMEGISK